MLSALGRLFALWYQFRGESEAAGRLLSRTELIQQSVPIQKKICRLAAQFLDSEDREASPGDGSHAENMAKTGHFLHV